MQAVAGQVEADQGLTVAGLNLDAQVRPQPVDARSPAATRPKPIHDGVLDPLRAVMAVIDTGTGAAKIHGERAIRVQVLFPGQCMNAAVEFVGIGGGDFGQHQQHPAGSP